MNLLNKYWKLAVSLLYGLAAFLFWWLVRPAMLSYHEQYQLFQADNTYIGQLLSVPDGVARCIGEYLTQTFINQAVGALIVAVILVLVQRLTWRVMLVIKQQHAAIHYALNFLPSLVLWLTMGDESVLMTFAIAIVAGVLTMWLYELTAQRFRIAFIIVALPVLYWAAGPVVLMTTGYIALRLLGGGSKLKGIASVLLVMAYSIGLVVASGAVLPHPLQRLFQGIDYYRFSEVYFQMLALVMLLGAVTPFAACWQPTAKCRRQVAMGLAEAVVLAVIFLLLMPTFYDARKYEVMEYDFLVRCNRWDDIISKAEHKTPDLPMTVCATNLALGMKGELGNRAFEFYQNGMQGLLPAFERNFSTLQLTGEAYWQLGLVNTAQRYAFESMEAIPNYAKSCRVVKRLAETNLVNGQYEVSRKYLKMLEKTMAYRKWARRTMALLGNEQQIAAHPVYGKLRQLRLTDDFLFSDVEIDKMFGQLLMHNPQNPLAMQYLLLSPLLERDVEKFMSYMAYVGKIQPAYRPRICQEAVALVYAQQNRQLPAGYVSHQTISGFSEFARIFSQAGKQSPELLRFSNTVWYYLMVGD